MSPFIALMAFQTAAVTKDAGLTWSFEGSTKALPGRCDLIGKEIRGEVNWFVAPKGHFDVEKLYQSDTQRTKEADATKGYSHVRSVTVFAGRPAIQSDQRYAWNGTPIVSRCVYSTQGNRAWVVRLWWLQSSVMGTAKADAFLLSCKRTP